MKDWSKTKQYKQLREDMINDLEMRGLVARQYMDKVDEYMRLWCWMMMYDDDVKSRGVTVEYQNGESQRGQTSNKSVTLALRVSSQMLSIWTALGFKDQAVSASASGGDDDEL